MKITKQGKLPGPSIYTGTCSHCSTGVECEQGEIKVFSSQKEGTDYCVKCPLCKNTIYLVRKL